MAAINKFSKIVSDPDFQALSAEEQFDVRRSYFQQHVGADPDFQALAPEERQSIGKSILFPEAKKEESFFGKLKSGQAFEGKAGDVVQAGLDVARQIGGAPEKTFENIGATFKTEPETQRLKEKFGKFVGEKTAEPIAKAVTAARAAGGALFGPIEGFIPRALVEKGGEVATAIGTGLATGARKLGLPEVIPAAIEEFTPDALFLAVGARLHGVTDLNAPLDRAFAKIEGKAPANTNDITRLAQEKPQEYAKAFEAEVASEAPAAAPKLTPETPIGELIKRGFPETEAATKPREAVSRETIRPKAGESGTQIETGAARPVESILPAAGKVAKWEGDIVKAGVIGADKLAELKAEAAAKVGEGISFDEVYQSGLERIAKTARKRTAASAKEAGDLLANFAIDPAGATGTQAPKEVRLKRLTQGDMRDMLEGIKAESDPENLFAIAQTVPTRAVRQAAANKIHDNIPAATKYLRTIQDPAVLSEIGKNALYDNAIRGFAEARAKTLSETAAIKPGSTIEPAPALTPAAQIETSTAAKGAKTAPAIEGTPAQKAPQIIPEAEPRHFRDRVFQQTPQGPEIRPAVKATDVKAALAETLREYGSAPEGMEGPALAEIDQLRRSIGTQAPPTVEGAPAGPKLTKYDTPEIIRARADKPIGELSTVELIKKGFGSQTGAVGKLTAEQAAGEAVARQARAELYDRIDRETQLAGETFNEAAIRLGLAPKQITALQQERAGGLEGKFPLSRLEEERGAPVSQKQFEEIPDPFKGSRLNTATTEAITRAATDFYKEAGLTLDKDVPISLQIARDLAEKKLPLDGLRQRLSAEGVTLRELADGFLGTATNAGRQLNQLAQVQKKLLDVLKDAKDVTGAGELLDGLKGPPPSAWEYAGSLFRRWLNIWKGLLVSQLSTTVRNLETQGVRVGIEAIEKVTDVAVRKIFRVGTDAERTFGEGSERAIELLKNVASSKRRALADSILDEFPDQKDRLFSQYTADVERATPTDARGLKLVGQKFEQITTGAEKVTALANTLNSMQEYLFRRAGFRAKLAEELRAKGQDIERIDPKAIDEAMIERAVDHGLEMTFATTPKGGLGGAIMDVFRAAPILGLVAPFPRFMINSWRTFLDFSPAGFLKLLSPAERAKIAQGDVKTVSRAIIGTGLLGSALALRDSEYAGEKWYEIQAGGKTYDARPFNPFATYLFVADLALKSSRGQLRELKFKDLTQGLFSANFRAGTGLFLLDKVGDVVGGLFANDAGESSAKALKEAIGQFLAGFLTPLQTFTDLLSDDRIMRLLGAESFAKEEAKVRETRSRPLTGPAMAHVPGLSQTLPTKEYPIGPENAEREEPLLKQFTGLLGRTKTAAQKESDRLGLSLLDLQRPVGIVEFDRLVAEKVRPKAEEVLAKIIESPGYEKRDDLEKRIQFKQVMSKLVNSAKKAVLGEHEEFREDVKVKEAGGDKGKILKRRFEELRERRGEAQ
jgi:hypothetical protein